MDRQNLTLLTDLYELTMMQGYFKNKVENKTVVFDAFFRNNPFGGGYSIMCGVEQLVRYIEDLHFSAQDIEYLRGLKIFDADFLDYLADFRFHGDIYCIPEGSLMFPREPMVKVVAPIMEAQLVETAILCIVNHQSLIATKAARIVHEAGKAPIMEFGLRRAQGPDAGTYGARAAVIAGCAGTSNVLCGELFGIPVLGTHAHSWIMSFESELDAFKAYADLYPQACTLLVDTYDTLKSGIPNAIRTFDYMKEKGLPVDHIGIRLDSGDLAYLTKKARKMLDDAGYPQAKITCSNDLDEYLINSLDDGTFEPKIKLSENTEKITNPGNKKIYRIYEKDSHKIKADLICFEDETFTEDEPIELFDPAEPWKKTTMQPGEFELRELMVPVFLNGKCVYQARPTMEIRDYCLKEQDTLWEESRRLSNPHQVYVDLSQRLYDTKIGLLEQLHH